MVLVIVVMRFEEVSPCVGVDADASSDLGNRLEILLSELAAQSGYESGWIGRSPDEPGQWTVVTIWDGAGRFRRALSSFEVKLALGSLVRESLDQASVFETIVVNRGGEVTRVPSSRAPDADTTGPNPTP